MQTGVSLGKRRRQKKTGSQEGGEPHSRLSFLPASVIKSFDKSADSVHMRRFPVVSTDPELNDRVTKICNKFDPVFLPEFLSSTDEALEYVRYELPEFQLLNFSDENLDVMRLVESTMTDPWLHYGGVIGVYARADRGKVEALPRQTNVVTMIRRGEFVETFFRVLLILYQNRQILFQRDIQLDFLGEIQGSFEMDNDPYNARTYASLLANFLFNSNYVDIEMRDRVNVALFEMIMNAVEHGNCGISYDEKTAHLEEYGDIIPLIREKCKDPAINARRVTVTYRISEDRSSFSIADEGEGFDWRSRFADAEVNLAQHGHGIRMTRHYIENLSYNEKGNQVNFEVPHQKQANVMPGIFVDQETVSFADQEIIFREGEESNDLYYIVSGKLEIYSTDQRVATLTADDIFLGEMSFLLGNQRSATVRAVGPVHLVKVTKNVFVNGIQKQPHYGIFLARLLAQRLSRLNRQVATQSV